MRCWIEGAPSLFQRDYVLRDVDAEGGGGDDGEVGVAAAGGFADGADVDDAHVGDGAIERDVAAAANDQIAGFVAESLLGSIWASARSLTP